MLTFLADENFNHDVLRGLARAHPDIDMVRVQDVGLRAADDPTVLAWAAGLPMPGVIEARQGLSTSQVIADLSLLAECGERADCAGRILYLPLR